MEYKAINPNERQFTFAMTKEEQAQTGLIGYLRGDFGSGKEFYATWWDVNSTLKSTDFISEFDNVINSLRKDVLKDYTALSSFCLTHSDASYEDDRNNYGIRIDTNSYSYLVRLIRERGNYNFYCYCFDKERLNECIPASEEKSFCDKVKELLGEYYEDFCFDVRKEYGSPAEWDENDTCFQEEIEKCVAWHTNQTVLDARRIDELSPFPIQIRRDMKCSSPSANYSNIIYGFPYWTKYSSAQVLLHYAEKVVEEYGLEYLNDDEPDEQEM